MSRASQQVAQEIVDALQSRISEWEAERGRIEIIRSRQDRKEERYQILGDLITAAEAEIANAARKIGNDRAELEAAAEAGVKR